MNTRFVNCIACQTEGRRLVADDIDLGPCDECHGACVVEADTQLIEMDDLP